MCLNTLTSQLLALTGSAKMLRTRTASRRVCGLLAAMAALNLDPCLNGVNNTAALFYVPSVALRIFCCSCTLSPLKNEKSSLLSSVLVTSR